MQFGTNGSALTKLPISPFTGKALTPIMNVDNSQQINNNRHLDHLNVQEKQGKT